MPSATESAIVARIMGGLNAPTPPECAAATATYQSATSIFNYARQEQEIYQGRSATDSVVTDMKNDKVKGNYGPSITPGITTSKRDNLYASLIRNEQNRNLYHNLMTGYHRN